MNRGVIGFYGAHMSCREIASKPVRSLLFVPQSVRVPSLGRRWSLRIFAAGIWGLMGWALMSLLTIV